MTEDPSDLAAFCVESARLVAAFCVALDEGRREDSGALLAKLLGRQAELQRRYTAQVLGVASAGLSPEQLRKYEGESVVLVERGERIISHDEPRITAAAKAQLDAMPRSTVARVVTVPLPADTMGAFAPLRRRRRDTRGPADD